ncbi:MAG: leucine-rich repeat domain-containing protein, partial [Clostridia bacterium]|nr:leucine-rich repeat domain-containing protein [Clostridia bacterium]
MKTSVKILCTILSMVLLVSCVGVFNTSAATYFVDQNFKFTKSENNDIAICEYLGKETEISIPSTLLGYKVETIGSYAFLNETNLKSITIPTTMINIEQAAFYGCTALESISLPVLCTNLGPYLFYGCASLTDVSLSTVTTDIPRYCFSHCDSLKELRLPDTVKTIGDYAFANCPELERVYIDRYTNSISDTAFFESPHVAIYGYTDTYAQTYAAEHAIPFYPLDQPAPTYHVTYYNYDGSVFWMTTVEEGKTALMPSKNPTKPSTDTHYYEFGYWDGNITNVQQNEEIYPYFFEYEIAPPDVFYVIFLNGDGTLISAQTVTEGKNATAPDVLPVKAETDSHYYVFTGWDKSYNNVTKDLIITPVFDEIIKEFNVTFHDTDNSVIATYLIPYGGNCPAPDHIPQKATDDEYGYKFAGWDKDLSSITSDIDVYPVFDKTSIKPQPAPPSTGSLKIEISGGTSFTIAIGDGAARPQGTSYMNSKAPVGALVTLTAVSTNGNEFLGWVNPANGAVVSKDLSFSFYTSGNDFFKAMFASDIDGVNMVAFYNAKAD